VAAAKSNKQGGGLRGTGQASGLPLIQPSAAAASSALGSTRKLRTRFRADDGLNRTKSAGGKAGVWIVYENQASVTQPNSSAMARVSHIKGDDG
jgi:hypothetical protein